MRCGSGKSGVNPGCAGSSPIQNIGAYGVELQRVCEYVDCIELETGRKQRLSAAECRFGYRDSIFKHEYQDRYAIVAIGLSLAKTWQPVLSYGDLTRLDPQTVTPQQVFDAVCHMRMTKLPDQRLTVMPAAFLRTRSSALRLRKRCWRSSLMHRTIRRQMAASSWPLAG